MGDWQQFGFNALWSPAVLFFIALIGFVYFMAIGPWRHFFKDAAPVSAVKKLSFCLALVLYYVAEGSPLNFYGHNFMFSFHMIQQSIAYLMVPPLLFSGMPSWMMTPLLENRRIKPWLKPITHPLLSVFLFNMLFSMYHMPLVFNRVYDHPWLHDAYHYVLLLTAFHMWFPVFCPNQEYSRLSSLQKVAYIFADGVLLTPACALIIFANKALYQHYATVPEAYTLLSVIEDQQLGGVVMKIAQEIIYGTVLAFIFFRWYHTERKKEEEEEELAAYDGSEMLSAPGNGNLNRV